METPKKASKRDKNVNRLKLHVNDQGGGRGLDVGGLVLWGGSLVIAGLITAFTIRNRKGARNGNGRKQEDRRDAKGLQYAAGKDQDSHHGTKQDNLCCMDKRMPDINIALENTRVVNYNLVHENPVYEISGKMDFDKKIHPPCDSMPEGVACGEDHQGAVGDDQQDVVAGTLIPADFPPPPQEMWNMNKGLSPVEQSMDLSEESKGSYLLHDEQKHEGELLIQLISDSDESLQASDATHVHKEEGDSPVKLILKEDESLLEANVCNKEKLEEEEPTTQSIAEEEEEEEDDDDDDDDDDDAGMEIGELLAQLLSDERTHQVPNLPHCEYMAEQESSTSSAEGGRGEVRIKPLEKHMEGDISAMSTEQDKGEDNNSDYVDEGIHSDNIERYNAEYHENNSEGTPASSIEETSFVLKETGGFSQDQQNNSHKNLSPLKKEVSSCFSCEKGEEEDTCNGSIECKHNPQPMPPFLGQVMHDAVEVAHRTPTLKAKNWPMFIMALFLLTLTLVYHRFVKSSVLNVDDFPSE